MATGTVSAPTDHPAAGLELDLDALRDRARTCTACDLYRNATQTVFGEGPPRARLLLVGEQPGDREDLAGEPFVGPAGRLLDRALDAAGIDRSATFVTNTVKHFKFTPRGKRRIHSKPNAVEIRACRPWLDAEIAAVDPTVVVALGATAAQALLGASFRVSRQRGEPHELDDGRSVVATVHPSSLLRITEGDQRDAAFEQFVADLRVAAERAAGS